MLYCMCEMLYCMCEMLNTFLMSFVLCTLKGFLFAPCLVLCEIVLRGSSNFAKRALLICYACSICVRLIIVNSASFFERECFK
jgi:hypothetical protein